MMSSADSSTPADVVVGALRQLQDKLIASLESLDGTSFRRDHWEREGGGGGSTCVVEGGPVLEKGGVNFSDVRGSALPPSASSTRPHLAGNPFRATGLSVVIHPRNPYAPTSHMNVRFFAIMDGDQVADWWFGGGFDLTPYYGFEEDAIDWHHAAKRVCDQLSPALYPRFKSACDEYFYLPHRREARGIGGIFFDDFAAFGFDPTFAFAKGVVEAYGAALIAILTRRKDTPYGDREREFQAYRRGRYAEFNLLYDRGSKFGLESGGRTESILMSLPPEVHWRYDWHPEPGSPEEALYRQFLPVRDWIFPEKGAAHD